MKTLMDLLPPRTLDYIRRFLADERSGQIVLEVKEGRVLAGHVSDYWRENGKEGLDKETA